MEVDDGELAGFAEEEGAVGVGVHEEVFGEDGGARRRFWAYSRRRPSGLRLPLVSMPWPLSMRIFIAGFSFRFLTVSYEKSARKARSARFIS